VAVVHGRQLSLQKELADYDTHELLAEQQAEGSHCRDASLVLPADTVKM